MDYVVLWFDLNQKTISLREDELKAIQQYILDHKETRLTSHEVIKLAIRRFLFPYEHGGLLNGKEYEIQPPSKVLSMPCGQTWVRDTIKIVETNPSKLAEKEKLAKERDRTFKNLPKEQQEIIVRQMDLDGREALLDRLIKEQKEKMRAAQEAARKFIEG